MHELIVLNNVYYYEMVRDMNKNDWHAIAWLYAITCVHLIQIFLFEDHILYSVFLSLCVRSFVCFPLVFLARLYIS